MVALDFMERDLANAIRFTSLPFRGTEYEIVVPTLIEGETPADPLRIGTVKYTLGLRGGGLRRTVWPFPEREPTGDRATTLARGLQEFNVSYGFVRRAAGEIEWRREATNLPVGVRVTVTTTNTAPHMEWQRTFRIPVGGE
jgi:hypothetical protein